jgi:hypothetical protein
MKFCFFETLHAASARGFPPNCMKLTKFLLLATCAGAVATSQATAQFFQIGSQASPANPPAGTNINVWPMNGAENPPNAIDNLNNTKYLNFGETNTGYIVTATGGVPTIATGIAFVTGNDHPDRDPATYSLFGSNSVILSSNPTAGQLFSLSNFTLISSGTLSLPGVPGNNTDQRGVAASTSFSNTVAYSTYLLYFPTVKDAGLANSMQVAEAAITGAGGTRLTPPGSPIGGGQLIPEPASAALLALTSGLVLLRRRRA